MTIAIDASGLADLESYFRHFPEVAAQSMSIALNETARGPALRAIRRDITAEVNFPDGYLDRPDRLFVGQYATPTNLEAKITGRDRPTSLARFTPSGSQVSRGRSHHDRAGINVEVHPGRSERFSSGFLISLKNGNVGFAIRLRPGETVRGVHRFQPIQLKRRDGGASGVFLLYGPSVDQVAQTVFGDVVPEVTSALEAEFLRQFNFRSGSNK